MIIACSGDWHLRMSNPINRIDKSYSDTLKEKLVFLFDYCRKYNATLIIAGDVFDSYSTSISLITWLIRNLPEETYGVIGNHDSQYRVVTDSCSISTLIESNKFKLIPNRQYPTGRMEQFYGCSFGEEIPKVDKKIKDFYNILAIHKMISNQDYWNGNLEYSDSKMFLSKHKFDLIVSSDNHTSFVTKLENRLLINPGSLCRARIDQMNHKPCFFVIDTDTQEYEQVFIPVRPAEEVFNLNIKEKKSENEDLTKLMNELKIRRNHEFNYLKQAEEIALESELDEWTKGSMMEVINEINQKGLK